MSEVPLYLDAWRRKCGVRVLMRSLLESRECVLRVFSVSSSEREFFVDNLLVRIHFIMVMIRWTGLAPWDFEFLFPGRGCCWCFCKCACIESREATSLGVFLWARYPCKPRLLSPL